MCLTVETISRRGKKNIHLLIEILGILKHFLVHLPRVISIWAGDAKLFNFLELVKL